MKTNRMEVLRDAFCQVLEKQTFLFADPTDKRRLPQSGPTYTRATMTFRGEPSGALVLAAPHELCRQIAANMLGMEPNDRPAIENGADALQEVLNVTCSHFLTSSAGETPVFDLSPPDASDVGEAEWKALLDDPNTLVFLCEDMPIALHLDMEKS